MMRNCWLPCLLALLLPAACAPARVAVNAPERLLLKRATKIYTLPKDGCDTYWIGTNTLLLVTSIKPKMVDSSQWKHKAERLDTRTNQRQADHNLTTMLNSLHMELQDCTPSPNGKWLLWQMARRPYDHSISCNIPVTSTASGRRVHQWGSDKTRNNYWIDNQHWVAEDGSYREGPRLVVRDVKTFVERDLPAYSAPVQAALSTNFLCGGLQYDALSDDNCCLSNPVTIVQYDRLHPRFPGSPQNVPYTNKHIVALPKYMSIKRVDIAANTNRVLYQVEYTSGQPRLIGQQHSANSRYKGTTFAGLWTSGVDGGDLHEIGRVALEDGDGNLEGAFYRLQWLPDGRHIGFIFKNTVYKIAAD